MNRILPALAVAVLLAAPAALAAETAAPADRAPPPKAPSAMTPTEIKAYNEGLAQTHPHYIKCRKTLAIGSLVKKNRVCYRSEEHTSELQSLMRISYAVFCLKKKNTIKKDQNTTSKNDNV